MTRELSAPEIEFYVMSNYICDFDRNAFLIILLFNVRFSFINK